MPQVKRSTSIGANSTVEIALGRFDRIGGRGARLKLFAAALTGASGATNCTFGAGSDTMVERADLDVAAAGPTVPEHQIGEGVGLPGDPIIVEVTNTTGGAIVVNILLVIQNAA